VCSLNLKSTGTSQHGGVFHMFVAGMRRHASRFNKALHVTRARM